MRGFALLVTFFGLVAGLFVLWQHRFERSPDFPTYRLANLRESHTPAEGVEWIGPESNPGIKLRFVKPDSPVVALLAFPGMSPVDFINVRFLMKAHDLALGRDFWDDGRLIIDWHPAGVGSVENDPAHSVRWNHPGEMIEFVMRPKNGPAAPVLRLEHRGRRGEFELAQFEATVLRETMWWEIGKWFLLAAWLGWACVLVLSFDVQKTWRALLAAAIWLTMCVYFVAPGPWKVLRPMVSAFSLGPEITKTTPTVSPPQTRTTEKLPSTDFISVGKIQTQGDLTLQIKLQLVKLRPVLHVLLLAAPALLISLLVGWRPSLLLTVLLSCSIEGAQAAFGYGFDWIDTWDLISDAFGIGVGLLLARILLRRLECKQTSNA